MRRFVSTAELLMFVVAVASPTVALGQTARPTVTAVANVASYGTGPISPGEMVVIFGAGMGPAQVVTAQLDQQGRVASTLSQVQILFDGTPSSLIYVSAKQISAMVPYSVAGKSSTQIQVVYQGSTSDSFQKPIAPTAPGLFTADSSGIGQAALTNADGSYNTTATPAAPGSYVTFYLTGEGQTNPSGSDGNVATSTANVALPVTVLIAGRTAQLLYAGSAPGNVNGFAQINAVVPADMQYGGNLPLVVQIGSVSSQTGVTLAVSGPSAPIPGTPQNPTASVNSNGQIVLTWTPADSAASRFHIERQVAGTVTFSEIAIVQAPSSTYTDAGVTAGTVYQYRLRAENDYGLSLYSAVTSATVPSAQLLPPSNVQAVPASQTQINLTWTTANTNAARFHVERKTGATGTYVEITTIPTTATSYQDTTVQPNTAYSYRMRSEGTSGFSAYSSEASATTPALPLPPSPTLQGTAASATTIHLSWTTTATGIIRFRLERRLTTGVYSEIAQPSATSTSFDDSGVTGSTSYLYRMKVETGAGLSAYSNEVALTTFPTAPTNLQATATSSSQVNLTWTNNAPDATAIRVEFLPPGSTTFTDSGAAVTLTNMPVANLQANTTYTFRVRAQNGAGYSAYSNVATAKTLQALPATPTNLQATASSSSQVNLTWTNNAPDATAIRVESHTAAFSTFSDIGAAVSLTSTGIINNQPNTTYTFRVRAQNGAGYSAYSNEATVTTPAIVKTLFLIHGIGQGSVDMQGLYGSLTSSSGIDLTRFRVDAGFDFSECANTDFCSSGCTISAGAQKLAQYIANANPPGDIILIGFSMGGLIARDMMANSRLILNGRRISALITLGTPNLGYPYTFVDTARFCTPLVQAMDGNWRSQQSTNTVALSPYLLSLTNQWPSSSYPGSGGLWLAASGRSCSNAIRTINASTGCRDRNPFSDGVVCDDSATYSVSTAAGTAPNRYWQDPSQIYVHTNNGFGASLILCGNDGQKPTLSNPPSFGPLFAAIKGLVNGL